MNIEFWVGIPNVFHLMYFILIQKYVLFQDSSSFICVYIYRPRHWPWDDIIFLDLWLMQRFSIRLLILFFILYERNNRKNKNWVWAFEINRWNFNIICN